jgi:hypothetical protein
MRVLGIEPHLFDERKVPATLRPLLPYASLLATGEEALWIEYWDALDTETKRELWSALEARSRDLLALAENPRSGLEWECLLDLGYMFSFLYRWVDDDELASLSDD